MSMEASASLVLEAIFRMGVIVLGALGFARLAVAASVPMLRATRRELKELNRALVQLRREFGRLRCELERLRSHRRHAPPSV